jgi:transposase
MASPFGHQTVRSQTLDHLGLVAGMYDELGIGEVLDRTISQDTLQRQVSIGQAVKALVLNGLGFINRALYLLPQFFADKPTERLIGAGIRPAHLNDDVLGRALDKLYQQDVTTLFTLLSAQAAQRLGLVGFTVHLDSTSFHVDGDYDHEEHYGIVEITKGYSRDRRPDLNQIMLNLIVENRAGLPLLMQPLSGNSNDTASFRQVIECHIDQLHATHQVDYWVADSALYSAANLQTLAAHGGRWITRVPETLKLAQQQCAAVGSPTELLPGYRYRRLEVHYGGVSQRWLVITSAHALKRTVASVERQLGQRGEQELKHWQRLRRQCFACEPDARQALADYQATLQVLEIAEAAVQRTLTTGHEAWQVVGQPASVAGVRWQWLWQRATFILATNELDDQRLSDAAVLQTYKQQSQVERGFRFLKDPRFQAHTLFLKSPQRIMALLMVMTVCLLVYAALEYRLRQALHNSNATAPDQKGKPTQRPTMRWVFQLFAGIHVLLMPGHTPMVLNLNPPQQKVIHVLGSPFQVLYL